MTSNPANFIFNSNLEYPPVLDEGTTAYTAGNETLLAENIPEGADFAVFITTHSGTYGDGFRRVVTSWVNSSNELYASESSDGTIYWRVYGY